jgi:hypothetical protein
VATLHSNPPGHQANHPGRGKILIGLIKVKRTKMNLRLELELELEDFCVGVGCVCGNG